MKRTYCSYGFHARAETAPVLEWERRIVAYMHERYPEVELVDEHAAELVIVLGGDGTLIEHIRKQPRARSHVLSLNLGHVGFLTSARDPQTFCDTVAAAMEGNLLPITLPSLEVTHTMSEGAVIAPFVNDLLLELPMTWITLRIELVDANGNVTLLRRSRGSGLYLSSAVGSTTGVAHHFGAPVMETAGRSVYLKGICDRSPQGFLVGTDGRKIHISIENIEPNLGVPDEARYPLVCFLDGVHAGIVRAGDSLEVAYRPEAVTVLRTPGDLSWDRWREAGH